MSALCGRYHSFYFSPARPRKGRQLNRPFHLASVTVQFDRHSTYLVENDEEVVELSVEVPADGDLLGYGSARLVEVG